MNGEKQSKIMRWVAGFLLGTVIPGYLGYIWMNERPPLHIPEFDAEEFRLETEKLFERFREFEESTKLHKENEQQGEDEPVEELETPQEAAFLRNANTFYCVAFSTKRNIPNGMRTRYRQNKINITAKKQKHKGNTHVFNS